MVDPQIMCRKHLLGEHLETHMFAGCINKGKRLDGYVRANCLEYRSLVERHDHLASEMIRRGFRHNQGIKLLASPLSDSIRNSKVNVDASSALLFSRCPDCRRRLLWTQAEQET